MARGVAAAAPVSPGTLFFLVAAGLILIARADRRSGSASWSVLRDWIPASLVLPAYWSVDWFAHPIPKTGIEGMLIGWDRVLLNDGRGQAAIERFGAFLPAVLELTYLLLYAAPPMAIGALYLYGRRKRVDHFHFTFLSGTLLAYALLPHFPSDSPRLAFPQDLAVVIDNVFRRLNLWILASSDIRSSVFPSGHVAVGFSTAFAMLLALPEKKWIGRALLALSVLVWINTIYGRYHYAADGLMSLITSLAAAGFSVAVYPRLLWRAARRLV